MLELKFIRNKTALDITNNTREILIFDRKTMIVLCNVKLIALHYLVKRKNDTIER